MTHSIKLSNEVLNEIVSAVESLRYGAVEITIHDGRVTQIEKREKVRFGQETSNIKPTVKTEAKH